jgi:hypothetical protein
LTDAPSNDGVALAQPAPPSFDGASVKPSAPSPGDPIYIKLGAARRGAVTMPASL